MMRTLLIGFYELGRQPFGLASPKAWLEEAGFAVESLDLAVEPLSRKPIEAAQLIALHLPMHTATRMAARLIPQIVALNPSAHLCCYGLYAPLNFDLLRSLGVSSVLGGEYEASLLALAQRLSGEGNDQEESAPVISKALLSFRVPSREGLPPLDRYAQLSLPNGTLRTVGYTEASRGCKHLCRHCPVVPVYGGSFRAVQRDVVLADIDSQVSRGAQHITFGDPDFFNGPGHATPIIRELHARHPGLTYDVTIKIQHLVKHRQLLPLLRDTGCLFVTSAVEAIDPVVLEIFEKHHSREDFAQVVRDFQSIDLQLNPTFVTFTPWTTLESYLDLLETLAELELIGNVAPIQYAIRLLITASSRLLELAATREHILEFDPDALVYRWHHPDPRMDQLHQDILSLIAEAGENGWNRSQVFAAVWRLATRLQDDREKTKWRELAWQPRCPPQAIPYLTEPWYC